MSKEINISREMMSVSRRTSAQSKWLATILVGSAVILGVTSSSTSSSVWSANRRAVTGYT